ncbi:hypothetical protein CVD25_01025 [Bacillus canaveralius]|uniref:Helix-turn-helix type 11 domain-containing protein n=1 Tax=Bacillus canaveralius TaxID=1403243 RepID=A0A2N5GPL3_9BACI|nr:hypothetical protein [Bacillus canaveralius]PLR84648.1 hypothetical protein CU635_06135 [Bacillus canaveralius]PLS00800.1 hypothetical protein CVD25_01025 [Bacillus canaveralius]
MTKLSPRLVEEVTKVAVQAAIEYLEKQEKAKKKNKVDRRLRNIKLLLRNYRSLKKHCEGLKEDIIELDEALALDEFNTDTLAIESIKKSKKRTIAMIRFVDQMLEVYRIMCEVSGKEEDRRRYRAVYLLYISEQKIGAEKIARALSTNLRTVYKDVDNASKALAVLVFGIDSIRFAD